MKVQHHDVAKLLHFESLIRDYLTKNPSLNGFISAFPSQETFGNIISTRRQSQDMRDLLTGELMRQNQGLNANELTMLNIRALANPNTFTVTTGHQLGLFTGPLYFIYKIVSTIKLAANLSREFPDNHFVPVFWMATEDHDFEEISSISCFGKNLNWIRNAGGPVGELDTSGLSELVKEFAAAAGDGERAKKFVTLLEKASGSAKLADATRILVHELFGEYGLVVIDGNTHVLKKAFSRILREELFESPSLALVERSNQSLKEAGYSPQAHAREINLFYLDNRRRDRIVHSGQNNWVTSNGTHAWTSEELNAELAEHPEHFSPNVILRPLYQEFILPNIAYIGGPGEIAYWLQLKAVFDHFKVSFPLLLLRDSALLLSPATSSKLNKLGLNVTDLFIEKQTLINQLSGTAVADLKSERIEVARVMQIVADKLKSIDPTLEPTVFAELKKMESALEGLEKKGARSMRQKEEVRLQQLEKVLSDVFPDGTFQERHDNYFEQAIKMNDELIPLLLQSFDPLKNKLTVISA